MKNTTLTALALVSLTAGLAAQTAPAATGLSYNRIGFTRSSPKNVASQNILSASALLGSSNFLAFAETRNDHGTALGLGHVFKNVAFGVDANVSVASDTDWVGNGTIYGLNLRRALNEVIPGLEIAIGYSYQATPTSQQNSSTENNRVLSYELSYNINKQYSVAYGIQDARSGSLKADSIIAKAHNISVRYNF